MPGLNGSSAAVAVAAPRSRRSLRRLFIVGAGGFGRELEAWLGRTPEGERDWRIEGFLDDNPDALAGCPSDYPVIARLDSFRFSAEDLVVLAVSRPQAKRAVVERLEGRVEFLTFLAPDLVTGKGVRIGRGSVVGMNCMLTTNVEVGEFVTINCHSSIGHDSRIGAYASLMGHAMVSGKCRLGEDAYLGAGATLIQGIRVGDRAVVAAGAVVFRNVKPDVTVVGNPARLFLDAPK